MNAQKLFTQEGKEYLIRTSSNSFLVTYGVPTNITKYVFINNPSGSSATQEAVKLTVTKNIIPISYSASAINSGGTVIADIANCYFAVQAGGLNFLPSYRNILSKVYPLVQRIYYTDALNNNYISRYNQLVLSNNDFISVSDPLAISFFSSLGQAMTQSDISVFPERFQLPAASYVVTFTFTYLELQ